MEISQAILGRLGDYCDLVARSKSHWHWPPGYLDEALPLMMPTRDYLARNASYELTDGMLSGFGSLVADDGRIILDNLWIDPANFGRGYGRCLCEHLIEVAREQQFANLLVYPDPPANPFYARLGFVETGNIVQSRVRNR